MYQSKIKKRKALQTVFLWGSNRGWHCTEKPLKACLGKWGFVFTNPLILTLSSALDSYLVVLNWLLEDNSWLAISAPSSTSSSMAFTGNLERVAEMVELTYFYSAILRTNGMQRASRHKSAPVCPLSVALSGPGWVLRSPANHLFFF